MKCSLMNIQNFQVLSDSTFSIMPSLVAKQGMMNKMLFIIIYFLLESPCFISENLYQELQAKCFALHFIQKCVVLLKNYIE